MALKLRPTGLGVGIDKDRQGYTVYSGGWDVGRIYEVRGGPEHLRWFWEKRSMRLGRLAGVLVAVLSVILAGSAAICGEWTRWQDANVAARIEQDGADLVVMCDTRAGRALHPESRGLILMFFREPRANWQKGAQLDVMTITDDGGRWDGPPSHGAAIEPTRVMIQNGATWELWVMGKAKTSFTISAGDYTRTFRAENLRKAVEPVLHECGDHW